MTTIAWDGKMLVAAKQLTISDLYKAKVTKIRRVKTGLLFGAGDMATIRELMNWFENGADPNNWPEIQKGNEWMPLHWIGSAGTIFRYDNSPTPYVIETPFYATGSGMAYALAAMQLGYDARTAVLTAAKFDPFTSEDIDVLYLNDRAWVS